jgi:hypothetical protein
MHIRIQKDTNFIKLMVRHLTTQEQQIENLEEEILQSGSAFEKWSVLCDRVNRKEKLERKLMKQENENWRRLEKGATVIYQVVTISIFLMILDGIYKLVDKYSAN